jgi:hypothetical protein
LIYKITSDSEVDWESSLISLTGVEDWVEDGQIIPNSPDGYTLDPETQNEISAGVWETTLTVYPRDGISRVGNPDPLITEPVSVVVSLTPKDSLGNAGAQVSSSAKSVLITNAYEDQDDPAVTLLGTSGDDFLFTDHDGDTLVGGAGADTIYIAPDVAAVVKLIRASDSSLSSYDTVIGFDDDDDIDIDELFIAAGYLANSVNDLSLDGPFTSRFTFENVTVNQSTYVASADVVYRGDPIKGGNGALQFAFNNFGNEISVSNEISTGNWAWNFNDVDDIESLVAGFSSVTNQNTTILSEGQTLFTVSFLLQPGDTSFLFSTSEVLLGDAPVVVLDQLHPKFAGTPNSGELVIYNDGSSLGVVGDNSLHFAVDDDGIHFKYDANSTAGEITYAEVYIALINNIPLA